MSTVTSSVTRVASTHIKQEVSKEVMLSRLLDMEQTAWQTITGLLQIHGTHLGEKKVTSELSSENAALKMLYMLAPHS